ncbi:large subunit GTPase 1-like protein [Micractinium conductrix]|uniref:Large subunit GTPase 1-like protein n=1 Tax=Micractinium conductrix TaxID=554055 RepID=A0A2P6V912_9CHLO|nr:large subunit GTPase 1-like protein [Micractinium conductrix]|eukprot:PSC70574.1 large subunit GTPase 1-like protein [Micractinium conductrix]
MGKHNGKARKPKGTSSVGASLVNRARRDGRNGGAAAYLHTTDVAPTKNMQSVIENNDLDEMMQMASLAGHDFTAEKEHVIVISTGAVAAVDQQRVAAERTEAEDRNRHRLVIPRRPSWDETTTPDQLEEQERTSFYDWRRDLASLEQDERLVLTPFEKNLEVWRQLWRVLERSDVVVQVVDARDPLTYRSEDLERYARHLHPFKASLLLLNKADLLPEGLRSAWADHFDTLGCDYVFWSAKAGMDELSTDDDVRAAAAARQRLGKDPRARVLGVDDLLELLEDRAAKAAAEAEAKGIGRASRGERLVVGLTGYPNVGKSSTINALFGSKKTAVAPTPGKTKHFQTLNVTGTLCLCDCPGLVLPQYAQSKAEMVAAGVIPIDRLTDVRAPVEAVGRRVGRQQLERVYGLHLPPPGRGEDPNRPPTALELLRSFAYARGWVASSGLPDETRAGRRLLKDYVDGKILYYKAPPGAPPDVQALAAGVRQQGGAAPPPPLAVVAEDGSASDDESELESESESESESEAEAEAVQQADGAAAAVQPDAAGGFGAAAQLEKDGEQAGPSAGPPGGGGDGGVLQLDEGDLLLMDDLDIGGNKTKQQRPVYKYHKKEKRSKGTRGVQREVGALYDGAQLVQGKRGGLVRVPT